MTDIEYKINDFSDLERQTRRKKMASTQEAIKESITVAQVGEFGIRVGDEWYGVNDPLESSNFVAGKTYDVLYKKGKPSEKYPQGKKYISQIVGEGKAVTAATVTKSSEVTDDKSIRILRQGVYQAVLQSPALAGFAATRDEYLALVKNTAEEVIKFIVGK
jgi:hypothetical protein